MADTREPPRSQYPPPDNPTQGGYYPQGSSPRDDRSAYPPPPDAGRHAQYPPPPHYPPPQQWPGQHHSAYPPPAHYPDPQHPYYAPPRPDMNQPPAPLQPDAYRLPPPYPPPGYPYAHHAYPPPPAPAPRQRTAIACKYCRKRKIRCSGYDNSPDGRCQNCVRFNQQCLFHPVSSQAAFVPASAVYGPNTRAPTAGQSERPNQNGQYPRDGEQPMLYGAHGQPLGPLPQHAQYGYPPPQGYAPHPYAHPGPPYHPNGPPYDPHGQAPPPQGDSSPHPNSRPRHGNYEPRAGSTGSYDYPDPTNIAPTSPATSTMSYQSHPTGYYTNGNQAAKDNTSPTVTSGHTPTSAQSFNSPHVAPVRDDGKTPPPAQPNSAASSANGRNPMSVRDMLGNGAPHAIPPEQRARNDNDMLNKLDGKKK